MGFVFNAFEKKASKNTLEIYIINLCLFYTVSYPLFIFLVNTYEMLTNISIGNNLLTEFIKSRNSFKTFLFIQVIPIVILLIVSIRERRLDQ